jgi:hypothetical protein
MNQSVINEALPALIPGLGKTVGVHGVIDVFSALGGANLSLPSTSRERGCQRVHLGSWARGRPKMLPTLWHSLVTTFP